jgi:hypothetical protein
MEFLFMISGNGLPAATECDDSVRERDATRALRDIQTLIAKLEVVNRLLAVPLRTRRVSLPPESDSADPGSAAAPDA